MTKIKGYRRKEAAKERPELKRKKAEVDEIALKVKNAKMIAVLDVRSLPDRILQSAKKKLRGKAEFLMAKNTVLKRALANEKKTEAMVKLLDAPTVVVLSNELSPYSLFKYFKDNKQSVAAKPGQIAPFEIIVHEGETDLPPGPALSELKGAGINAKIAGGKIAVAKDSTVAKAGDKISDNVCKALQKLNILPFKVGVRMVAGVEGGFLYNSQILDIDEIQLAADLGASASDAYNMSINIAYPTDMNRIQLLSGALAQARALVQETGVYSDAHMELLLTSAIRMQEALEGKG